MHAIDQTGRSPESGTLSSRSETSPLRLIRNGATSTIAVRYGSALVMRNELNVEGRNCHGAHIPCLCNVPKGERYCGDACRDAGSKNVEIGVSMRPFDVS